MGQQDCMIIRVSEVRDYPDTPALPEVTSGRGGCTTG